MRSCYDELQNIYCPALSRKYPTTVGCPAWRYAYDCMGQAGKTGTDGAKILLLLYASLNEFRILRSEIYILVKLIRSVRFYLLTFTTTLKMTTAVNVSLVNIWQEPQENAATDQAIGLLKTQETDGQNNVGQIVRLHHRRCHHADTVVLTRTIRNPLAAIQMNDVTGSQSANEIDLKVKVHFCQLA